MGSDPIFQGVLLAAGASRRFGANKLLHSLAGKPVAVHAAESLGRALRGSIAVIRPDPLLRDLLEGAGLRVVECARADDGMGVSLAAGVAATPDARGWIVALADMPWIRSATHGRVAQALFDGAELAAAAHQGQRGHPVGIGARFRGDLLALTGDAGARELIAANSGILRLVECGDPAVLRDIDTPADLA
ncbi:MAG: NTP transferase domain-containing protein [Burkholderiales bacterium]